jgi:RNA recognition motif-containing protein
MLTMIPTIAWWTLLALTVGLAAGIHYRRRFRRRSTGDCIEIYVGNLSYDMTEAQLRKEFERYGAVKSARIIENRFNHKSKGFGFVEMLVRSEAEAAIRATHDKDILGRRLRVNEAKNKSRE